jgi:hypothetical protein
LIGPEPAQGHGSDRPAEIGREPHQDGDGRGEQGDPPGSKHAVSVSERPQV